MVAAEAVGYGRETEQLGSKLARAVAKSADVGSTVGWKWLGAGAAAFILGVHVGMKPPELEVLVNPVDVEFDRIQAISPPSILGSKWKDINFYVGPEWTIGQRGSLHSQVGQEWLVASILGCKRDGYFLDLAANDAEKLSNTLTLERDFGWRGICVEANRKYMYGLARRKCDLVIGAAGAPSDQEVTFNLRGVGGGIVGSGFDNTMAIQDQSVTLRTVSVTDILEALRAPERIDFFSLDVEGAESMVMQGFNWTRHRFSLIGVERPKQDLAAVMDAAGYKLLRQNAPWGDFFYVDSQLPEYAQIAKTWRNNPEQGLPASCMDSMGYLPPVGTKWRTYERQEQLQP